MPGERSEQATQHRRDKARKDGDLLHSKELSAAAATLAGVLVLTKMGGRMMEAWRSSLQALLELGSSEKWEPSQLKPTLVLVQGISLSVLAPVGLVLAAVASAALGVGMMQTGGLNLHVGSVGFRLDRINPLSNLKNLFSLRAVGRMAKSLIPVSFLGLFAWQRVGRQWALPPLSTARLMQLGSDLSSLLMTASWLLFGWALIDYAVEWRSRESRLKMSREDLRNEFKETEGNPQIRSRIRGLQRQARRGKVKADVSKAAVVVTNPTHFAVALGFDFVEMNAPKVLAKGRNLLAEEIKAEARWAGVPILENPPLARSLYRSVEVGQSIPVDLYAAVASILAFLYRQRVEQEARERQMREKMTHAAAAQRSADQAVRRTMEKESR